MTIINNALVGITLTLKSLAFCVASPPILIAFSVALLAILDAEEENIDQPYKN